MEKLPDYFLWLWYNFIGYTECHQLVERTIKFDSKFLFVCCRCSAIYTGYCIAYVFIWLSGRIHAISFPPRKVIIMGIFLSSLMFLDVGSLMLGLREGSNDIRIVTGFLAGSSFTFLVIPGLNRLLGKSKDTRRVIDGLKPYLYLMFLTLPVLILMKTGWSLFFWPFFIIIGTGLILDYINLNSIALMLFLRIFRIYKSDVYFIILMAVIMSFIEKLVVYRLFKVFNLK